MNDTPERDRARELVEYLEAYAGGFGTVEICTSGFRWVGSIDDLREAMRRLDDPAPTP